MNGEPNRNITECPKGAPQYMDNHRTINSFIKNLQLNNNENEVKNAIQRVRCVNYT